jgi:hypothetical protein
MKTTTGAILLVIGVVALFAAIVGGGVKIKEIEVGSLPSRWRQVFLAIFGIVVGSTGLYMVMNPGEGGDGAEAATQNGESLEQGIEVNASETASDANAADQNAEDASATSSNESETTSDSNSGEEPTE